MTFCKGLSVIHRPTNYLPSTGKWKTRTKLEKEDGEGRGEGRAMPAYPNTLSLVYYTHCSYKSTLIPKDKTMVDGLYRFYKTVVWESLPPVSL